MKTSSRFRMLLLELVCNLCIFVLCALVCIALFIKADALSQKSSDLTQSVYLAQSAAERWKSGQQPETSLGDYQILLEPLNIKDGIRHCNITIVKDEEVIYTLKGVSTFE